VPEIIRLILDIAIIVVIITAIILFSVKGKSSKKKIKVGVGPASVEMDFSGMDEQTKSIFDVMWSRVDELREILLESKKQYKEIAEQNRQDLSEIKSEVTAVIKKVDGMFIDHLKVMFYMPTLDDEEKLCAGLKYIHAGLNHTMKKDVIEFAIERPSIYRSLTLAKPEWKVEEIDKAI